MLRSAIVFSTLVCSTATQAQVKDVTVAAPTRLDYAFAVRGFGKDAGMVPANYSSTAQKYQLFVPKGYSDKTAWPLVVLFSASNQAAGWTAWKKTCEKDGSTGAPLLDTKESKREERTQSAREYQYKSGVSSHACKLERCPVVEEENTSGSEHCHYQPRQSPGYAHDSSQGRRRMSF
jgi:hypothetical protein